VICLQPALQEIAKEFEESEEYSEDDSQCYSGDGDSGGGDGDGDGEGDGDSDGDGDWSWGP
jgi:hypothetical protein